MNDFQDKNIWIIGCSSGIGYALAKELSGRGAKLILSARRKDKLETLNAELGGTHLICPVDVGDYESVCHAVGTIKETQPKLDSVLFLAATFSPHDGQKKDISTIHEMLNVNLGGAFNMLDVVLPIYEEQGFGQILLCGSVAGFRGLPTGQPYCAGKAAIINLAESLKMDLEGKNIDVKVINPGFVKTPITDKNDFPMPMMIEADEAAKAIAKGMQSRSFEIHFPKKFTYLMKLLHILPAPIYFWVMRRVRNHALKSM